MTPHEREGPEAIPKFLIVMCIFATVTVLGGFTQIIAGAVAQDLALIAL